MNLKRFHFVRITALLCCITTGMQQGKAQHYYNDIVLTTRNAAQQQLYKTSKVKHITLSSFEANGRPTENFSCEVIPTADYRQTITHTRSEVAGNAVLTTFYDASGRLSKSTDSTSKTNNTYTYMFDGSGKLTSAASSSQLTSENSIQTEAHIWSYDGNNRPQKMLQIKNGNDTTLIRFTTDEKGNIAEEETFRKGVARDKVYYYYDDRNRLTDIVRYNNRLRKLMPESTFDYNDSNQLTEMLTIQQGSNYLVWTYAYDSHGLKTQELCADKQRQPVGRIEYTYEY